ncbi:hypothetical protein Nepgr_018479 [Nepenthes gracilis]|uniref:Protein kinase domain-containing protein n=1 Tax=Nepenthes gracilis TaxID=150966 RepID=A0AAD3SRG1_NEPGR|nr:hypothetical protein Nepgr_018479 [Nepenthes gracilis]
MCNKGTDCLEEPSLHSNTAVDHEQRQAAFEMDGPSVNSGTLPNYSDEKPHVKFLCSFSGSILPRPQDGKLRYVGGETRIVSVPCDITYEELMARMRELYEDAAILKYQQPEEDLDALVTVVNDDDVTNMMEEYDKLGSGDGFTRLRVFLFSHPDQDASPHYIDVDERDNERRYVDALNSLNESPDYSRHQHNDSPVMIPADNLHIADQFFNSMNFDGGIYNQRNYDIPTPQYNLQHLAIPNMGSGQYSVPTAQRYNEESPWSPAYCSPRFAGPYDPHSLAEFPSSPSSARFHTPFAEVPDNRIDRIPEENNRQQVNHQPLYENHTHYSDNVVWLTTGGVPAKKGGFPGNILHGPSVVDGNKVCENCRMAFQRNRSCIDSKQKHEDQSYMEQSSMGNGFPQVGNACVECLLNREVLLSNTDLKLQHGGYNKEQTDPQPHYGETQASESRWILQHQLNPRSDEPRVHISGAGKVNEHYIVDGAGMNFSVGHGNISDGHHIPPSYIHHDDSRYIQSGPELGTDVFHGQVVAAGSHIHIPLEEQGGLHANFPCTHGADNSYQLSHGHSSAHILWQNVPSPVHTLSTYDPSALHHRHGFIPGLLRTTFEGSPRFAIGVDQNPWVESSQKKVGTDGTALPEYSQGHGSIPNHGVVFRETQQVFAQDFNGNPPRTSNTASHLESARLTDVTGNVLNDKLISSTVTAKNPGPRADMSSNGMLRLDDSTVHWEGNQSTRLRQLEGSDVRSILASDGNGNIYTGSVNASLQSTNSNCINPAEGYKDAAHLEENERSASADNRDLSFLPELVASLKKSKLESVEVVKARAQEDANAAMLHYSSAKNGNADERESVNGHGDSEGGSENENPNASKIEPTKAEEEAIARGLQTIRNDDLEEIRELGSGTYGAVFHGKWKGSDVAIKRIKASCFAGRPSERERLIEDFWKEALILSSLHHPNVVSFYGVVRDGPDGSLATVTEFMVNGSLKQYLRKKDRTIDRRKRLIIAMDTAFGMEYLHGKDIVHFDLKCENLLVNMRDPHRPVCKIGDMGLSKVKQHTLVSGGVRGTLPWMAPELLSGKSSMVTEKIDVYSFGIVMWELLTGDEPYADMHCASIIGGIVNSTLRPEIPTETVLLGDLSEAKDYGCRNELEMMLIPRQQHLCCTQIVFATTCCFFVPFSECNYAYFLEFIEEDHIIYNSYNDEINNAIILGLAKMWS